jgi:ATP-dependent DNA helicase RecQ
VRADSAPAAAGIDPARDILREVFGYDDFRPGQRDAVDASIGGRDALVLLPTGSGKSVCYQVPALVARRRGGGTTVVVSPLIALMHDQVTALCGRGVAAGALHSNQDEAARAEVVAAFTAGALDLLYVSPERAAMASFRRLLGRVRVALLAVDEAHCVSQWGHDFRPDYLRIHELRAVVGAPLTALTATATPAVMDEIAARLCLREPTIVRGDFSRPNLRFAVRHERGQDARLTALRAALDEAGLGAGGRGIRRGRALVYCSTRKTAETVAKALRAHGLAAGYYHAGRTKLARERAHRAFALGRTPVLVATNAFGMGIDFPDVRLIVHFQAPGSLEAYYQEAGRAGRDGAPATCLLFFGPGDLATQRRLSQSSTTSAAIGRRNDQALAAVERYAHDRQCRQQALCVHFTGNPTHPVCGHCDVCLDPAGTTAGADEVAIIAVELPILDAAARDTIVAAVGGLRRPVGKTALARALRGSRAKALARTGLLQVPECGRLKQFPEAAITATIAELLAAGRLVRKGRKYPTVWLPDRPVRPSNPDRAPGPPRARSRSTAGPVGWALENYRKRMARTLRWKAYMVLQRRVILAIERQRPATHAELLRVAGLGPAKLARFGDDILDVVRRHGTDATDN